MAYAFSFRRAVALLMISATMAGCSSSDLVPPAAIDSGRVGAIQPTRSIPPEPVSQPAYQMSPAPVSQTSAMDYMGSPSQPRAPMAASAPMANDGGHYLRAPDQVQSASLGAPAPAATRAGRLPMIDSDEAMRQQSQPSSRNFPRGAANSIPQNGVNIDAELGVGPDESDVTGLAEEEESNIAEGVGDQPVVDGIGTDNPRALRARRQPISDDRVVVPPKRQGSGIRGDMANGSAVWGDNSPVVEPRRVPSANSQQVAMLRPNNPATLGGSMTDQGPMSQPDQPWLRNVMPQSEVSCRAELRSLGVEFKDLQRISNGPSCGIDYPVKLSGLGGGIAVSPAVTLNCQTTLAFAKWVKNELNPSARLRYFSGIGRIQPLGGYSCRRMNNSSQRYNPMSEHAKGNAIDVGAIVLKNGHDIDVRKKGLFSFREGALLKSVRSDSCKYFSTVLGPGSNAEHWNHFHFDLRDRKGGRRYCD
ncbi:extensin-like domain-containing protein [Neorhizobium alkalisoli]|uniref:Extensin-like C-terminal domain-containing protein n=1 Tax=Neorhizobium alkalisoli TaxID=528178 RepID=A0A561QHC3_9HYPH|nr:extensin family protein [Neorhizobium alkalisoli]TWF49780.1 hypothetical protein FHW37_107147 [Neorhizobium alkalisoli]